MNKKIILFLVLLISILSISYVSASGIDNADVGDSSALADESMNVEIQLESIDDVNENTVAQSSQTDVSGPVIDDSTDVSGSVIDDMTNVSESTIDNPTNVSGPDANNTANVTGPKLDIKGPKTNGSAIDIKGPKITDSKNPFKGTFDSLQVRINDAASGSTLDLFIDYVGANGSRIQLNKDLTINGHGHTLDCAGKGGCSAFYSEKGNIILKNLRIINGHNDYSDKGGAIYIKGSAKYTLENCVFENNWADDYGGAIYNGVDKALTIKNCIFKGNTADDDDGGAIFSEGVLDVENTTFENNKADDYGGAIDIESDKKSTFKNCIFKSNTAGDDDGGAIFSKGELDIVNSTFDSNKAYVDGGAIFSKKNVNVFESIFKNNAAEGAKFSQCYGGAIRSKDTVNIENSTFVNNTSEDYGGVVYAEYINVNQKQSGVSTFRNNAAKDNDGGALYGNKKVVISNSKLMGNRAFKDGGAVFANSNVTVKNSELGYNTATGPSENCHGGAIYSSIANLFNSTFSYNVADQGGAIYTVNLEIGNGEFTHFLGNKARNSKNVKHYNQTWTSYDDDNDIYMPNLIYYDSFG